MVRYGKVDMGGEGMYNAWGKALDRYMQKDIL